MALKQKFNPISGDFDLVDDLSTVVGKTTLTGSTTNNTITTIGTIATTTDTVNLYEVKVVGKQTAVTTEGTVDNQYVYEANCVVQNISGTVTIEGIDGTVHKEDLALPIDASTGHALTLTIDTTSVDLDITGLDGTISWEIEVSETEV